MAGGPDNKEEMSEDAKAAQKKIDEMEAEIQELKRKHALQNVDSQKAGRFAVAEQKVQNSKKKPNHRAGRWVQSKKKWSKIRENRAYAKEIDRRLKEHLAAGLKPNDFSNNQCHRQNNYRHRRQPFKQIDNQDERTNKN